MAVQLEEVVAVFKGLALSNPEVAGLAPGLPMGTIPATQAMPKPVQDRPAGPAGQRNRVVVSLTTVTR